MVSTRNALAFRTATTSGPALAERNGTRPTNGMGGTVSSESLVGCVISANQIISAANKASGIGYHSKEAASIRKAYAFAQKAHEGQTRVNGDPYIEHTTRTALYVAEIGGTPRQIRAALLHDVMEDCGVAFAQLKKEFGTADAMMVALLTKPKWNGRRWVFADQAAFSTMLTKEDVEECRQKLETARTKTTTNPKKAERLADEVISFIKKITGISQVSQLLLPLGGQDKTSIFIGQASELLNQAPQDRYDDSMADERDTLYFRRLQKAKAIGALVVKLEDSLTNLETIGNLKGERQLKNLRKIIDRSLFIAARIDYSLFDKYVQELDKYPEALRKLGYELVDGTLDRAQLIAMPNHETSKTVLLSPRRWLNENMVKRLPVRYPGNVVIAVYASLEPDKNGFHRTGSIEIGLPRINGNGHYMEDLRDMFGDLGLIFRPGKSLLLPTLSASEKIYIVEGERLRGNRDRALAFFDGEFLPRLEQFYDNHLASHRQPPPFTSRDSQVESDFVAAE